MYLVHSSLAHSITAVSVRCVRGLLNHHVQFYKTKHARTSSCGSVDESGHSEYTRCISATKACCPSEFPLLRLRGVLIRSVRHTCAASQPFIVIQGFQNFCSSFLWSLTEVSGLSNTTSDLRADSAGEVRSQSRSRDKQVDTSAYLDLHLFLSGQKVKPTERLRIPAAL